MTTPERHYEKDLADAHNQIRALRAENAELRARCFSGQELAQVSRRLDAALDLIHLLTERGDSDEH